jgi:hypothetical protein
LNHPCKSSVLKAKDSAMDIESIQNQPIFKALRHKDLRLISHH